MTAIELLGLPPVEWEILLAKMSPAEREDMTGSLSHIMERAALARGYMDGAYLFGTGTHARGVKAGNALRVKIRTALGFAYPKNGNVAF